MFSFSASVCDILLRENEETFLCLQLIMNLVKWTTWSIYFWFDTCWFVIISDSRAVMYPAYSLTLNV